jgi:hypothetical protein
MRYVVAVLSLLAAPACLWAEAPAAASTEVDGVIERGLAFLVKDALAWKAEHGCASCHHASLVISALGEAKGRGVAVDETFLAETTKWVAESGDGKTGVPRPEGKPKALNTKAVYFALGLAADPHPDAVAQASMKRFVETIVQDQIDNGSWVAWPETRPPFFGDSDEAMTALAVLALLPAAASGDETAKAARDRGVAWLEATASDDDPQSTALRLVLWQRLARPGSQCEPLARKILERQNPDGGWSQAREMASDAWATGQALYALAHTGLKSGNPTIDRAHAFLARTQREDGSWPMTSRPTKPGGTGSNSLIPITGGGSAWAVIGLAKSR